MVLLFSRFIAKILSIFNFFIHKIATFFAKKLSFGEITSNCTGFL